MLSEHFAKLSKWIDENREREDIKELKWVIMDGRRCLRVVMVDGGVWDAYTPFDLYGI